MGNSNSNRNQTVYHHSPVTWTQSFPRERKRLPKVSSANKVLPPPTAAKLRPTENGRSLHVAGTITGRRAGHEPLGPQSLPGYGPPCLAHPHGPPPHLSSSMTHLHQPPCALHHPSPLMAQAPIRFGAPPSKVYTSEPDLRSNGAPFLPPPSSTTHTIISQSPTKGRIKSKKRNKAPPPPASGALSDGGQVVERGVHWGTTDTAPSSRPPSQASKGPRKLGGGLFKKRNESRKSDNESSFVEDNHSGRPLYRRMESSPASSRTVKEERRERARSVDCLQHELRNGGSHLDRVDGPMHPRRSCDGSSDDSATCAGKIRCRTIERESRRGSREDAEQRMSTTLDRAPAARSPGVEKPDDVRFQYLNSALTKDKRYGKERLSQVFDEWEEAEREMIERKKAAENMRQELQTAAKNLRKTGGSKIQEQKRTEGEREVLRTSEKDSPKTFFFGMEPSKDNSETIRIEGTSVEYSRKDKTRHSRVERRIEESSNKQEISNDVDDFVVAIAKRKQQQARNLDPEELFINSPLRKEDGGYHSRQNSGSFHLEPTPPEISVNLRPILPKRQREIPRFSPNAAWKFLGEEPFLSEENLNESRSSDDIIYEDKIRGYARPIAPPRGSGEKSADSGISGDAGSPGPMPEFEAIKIVQPAEALETSGGHWRGGANASGGGPLAASSPMVSADVRRAWTPAQDLDENSMDGSGEVHNAGITSPPKLTNRRSMFDVFDRSENLSHKETQSNAVLPKLTSRTGMFSVFANQNDSRLTTSSYSQTESTTLDRHGSIEESTQTSAANLRKLKRSVSSGFNNNKNTPPEDKVPHNAQNDKWRDNWTMTRSIPNSLNNEFGESSAKTSPVTKNPTGSPYRKLISESNTSSYPIQSGHIMYLPEYNSHPSSANAHTDSQSSLPQKNKLSSSRENSLSSPSDVTNITSRELNSSRHLSREGPVVTPSAPRWGAKRGKKFSYQSTVRILEKRKREEELDREVAAKEQQRLQEIAAMKQVEEEFQLKREREKKRLKQQLKMYQIMQGNHTTPPDDTYLFGELPDKTSRVSQLSSEPPSSTWNERDSETSSVGSSPSKSAPKKPPARQAPDGAPALSSPRQEVLEAARQRNGHLVTQELEEFQQPRREYREYRRSQRPNSSQGGVVGDNYRRDFSRGQTQTGPEERLSRNSNDSYRPEVSETGSTCSSRSVSVVRVVNGKTTRYFEHPAATGNMAPAGMVYQMEAYNRHVNPNHSKMLQT